MITLLFYYWPHKPCTQLTNHLAFNEIELYTYTCMRVGSWTLRTDGLWAFWTLQSMHYTVLLCSIPHFAGKLQELWNCMNAHIDRLLIPLKRYTLALVNLLSSKDDEQYFTGSWSSIAEPISSCFIFEDLQKFVPHHNPAFLGATALGRLNPPTPFFLSPAQVRVFSKWIFTKIATVTKQCNVLIEPPNSQRCSQHCAGTKQYPSQHLCRVKYWPSWQGLKLVKQCADMVPYQV